MNATDPTIGGVILAIKQSCLGGVSRAIIHGTMKQNSKTTRRMIPVLAQIVQRLPGHLIESIASRQRIRAREFSYSSQIYTLMLGQFLHAFILNERVDTSEVHRAELSRIRGISPAKRNTFSNANRTRDPVVAERFYWALREPSQISTRAGGRQGSIPFVGHGFAGVEPQDRRTRLLPVAGFDCRATGRGAAEGVR